MKGSEKSGRGLTCWQLCLQRPNECPYAPVALGTPSRLCHPSPAAQLQHVSLFCLLVLTRTDAIWSCLLTGECCKLCQV